jgi:hypothetical protein
MSDGGKKVIRLEPTPTEGALQNYAALLGEDDASASALAAASADELRLLRRAVQARLRPAPRAEVAAAVMVLAGSFKLGSQVEDPEIFVSAMIEELSDYPADILETAVRAARRGLRCLPASADMVEICDALMAERRCRLAALERLEAQKREEQP